VSTQPLILFAFQVITLGAIGCSAASSSAGASNGGSENASSPGGSANATGQGGGGNSTAQGGSENGGGLGAGGSAGGSADAGIDPPPPGDAVSAAQSAILAEREGWGNKAEGGLNGKVHHVTTLADSGPGSLREALTIPEPLWIVFDLDGTIVVNSSIYPTSDKTVDGRGRSINIRTDDHLGTPLKIFDVSNIVLLDLSFHDDWPDWKLDSEGSDGVNITNSHDVWIHHCDFSQWRDGAIDMTGASYVSVTWSRFSKIDQALNWGADYVSAGHNWCEQVLRRCIKIRNGKGHSYNNVVKDWGDKAIQCAVDGGGLYSDRNIFVPGSVSDIDAFSTNGKMHQHQNHATSPVTFLGPSASFDSSFESQSEQISNIESCSQNDSSCWNALMAKIQAGAGTTL
jgi:pectate lyase